MTSYQSIDQSANRKNLGVLVNLRGMAFCAQVAAILTTYYGLSIVLPVSRMLMMATVLAVFNIYSFFRQRSEKPIRNRDLFAGLVVDVVVLATQLYFSGGTSNPFVSFFMLPVIIGAVMLDAAYAWAIYGLTLVAYISLAIAGLFEPMPKMMDMPGMDIARSQIAGLIDGSDLHMNGMMLGYALSAGVLVFLISRIRANLKARDIELERLKASALEESHIIRMGLLSAGAAHELGTPLTTLSVILKDLIDLPLPRKKEEIMSDLLTMSTQVDRCKSIVSGILTSSGEVRAEGAEVKALDIFLKKIVDDWQHHRPQAVIELKLDVPPESIVADRVIGQVLFNLLDNALEAGSAAEKQSVNLSAIVEKDTLSVLVADTGPGFSDDVLAKLGQPYITTKAVVEGGHRRGLGLFLVNNALRKLGGSFKGGNSHSPEGTISGAIVHIALPLSSIRATRP